MTPDETVILARYVRALAPQQRFDEYTPDAWYDVLGEYHLNDAREAAARIARRQPFVAPAEIAGEITLIRRERLDDFQYEPVPGDDDPVVYLTAYRQQLAATGDGRRPAVIHRAITGPTVPELLTAEGVTVVRAVDTGRRGPLGIICPTCAAPIGRPCRNGLRIARKPHNARRRVAQGDTPTETLTAAQATAQARHALAQLTPEQRAELFRENQ